MHFRRSAGRNALSIFCLYVLCSSAVALAGDSLSVCRKQVSDLLAAKHFDEAHGAVIKALKLYPREPWLLARAAQICVYLERDEEANLFAERAERSMQEKPWDAETAFWLANVFRQLDAYDKSMQVLKLALSRFPTDRALRRIQGENYLKMGAPARSEELFQGLCREYPDNFMNWLNLLDAQEKQRKWQSLVESGKLMEKAAAALPVTPGKPAVKDSVIFARCLSRQAKGYMKLGRWQEAKTCLERVLRIIPLDRPTLVDHMMVCAKLNDKVGESVDRKKLSEFDKGL